MIESVYVKPWKAAVHKGLFDFQYIKYLGRYRLFALLPCSRFVPKFVYYRIIEPKSMRSFAGPYVGLRLFHRFRGKNIT